MILGEKERRATGSRYICNPPPMDTDNDVVILVEDLEESTATLITNGWDLGGSLIPGDSFRSLKKGEDNYILIEDTVYYENFVLATDVAKKLNLLNKPDRIMLFEAFLEGYNPIENELVL